MPGKAVNGVRLDDRQRVTLPEAENRAVLDHLAVLDNQAVLDTDRFDEAGIEMTGPESSR